MPALTALFSDALPVTSIAVVSGGTTTITCSAAHTIPVGKSVSVSITDAETPNPVTAATLNGDGTITLTTQYDHDLTTTPNPDLARPWHTSAKLSGFGSALIDGVKQLVAVLDRKRFVIQPSGEVASITVDGGEVLLERLDYELIGYHKVVAATSTTLTFTTPLAVTRSYTVTSPVVARNLRFFGSLSIDTILDHYTRPDNKPQPAGKCTLFVCPVDVRTSRSRASQTDAIADASDGSDHRQLILDGFEVFAVIPSEDTSGGVKAIDLAQGEILTAVLRTFYGLKMRRPEFEGGGSYVALLESHGAVSYDKVNYVHRYRFQAPAYVTNADAIAPYDWPDINPDDLADSLFPIGAPAFRDLDLDQIDGVGGITRQDEPGALTGTFIMDGS